MSSGWCSQHSCPFSHCDEWHGDRSQYRSYPASVRQPILTPRTRYITIYITILVATAILLWLDRRN